MDLTYEYQRTSLHTMSTRQQFLSDALSAARAKRRRGVRAPRGAKQRNDPLTSLEVHVHIVPADVCSSCVSVGGNNPRARSRGGVPGAPPAPPARWPSREPGPAGCGRAALHTHREPFARQRMGKESQGVLFGRLPLAANSNNISDALRTP